MTDLIAPIVGDADLPPLTTETTESKTDVAAPLRTQKHAVADQPSPPKKRRSLLRRTIRFALFLAVAGGLAAAVVVAAPVVNERIIQPVETNTADTAALESAVGDVSSRLDAVEAEAATLRSDLDTVADDVTSMGETVGTNTTRLDDVDTLIADQSGRLDDLDALAVTLGDEIGAAQSATAREIEFLKSTELLSRARLFLYQANYGLAAQDVQAARDLLAGLQASELEDGPVASSTLTDALARVDLVLAALPGRPVAASDDLDIAWRLLLDEPLSPLVAGAAEPVTPAGQAEGLTIPDNS